MTRKEFIRLASTAGIGVPFMVNGVLASPNKRGFLDMPMALTPTNVNDRVLVIVRLQGANDGLNTIIPIQQYDTYAALRPTIKILDSGTNKFIELDTTLEDARLSGLHPSLTAFKHLYDAGKLAIINGVGYPSPNLSHFKGQNIMFGGRDGENSEGIRSGIFGRYLAALYPDLAGTPTNINKDPLVINMGDSNPNLFYGHDHKYGIEYNISTFQNNFFSGLRSSRIVDSPNGSDYLEVLEYLKGVSFSSDFYYNQVVDNFNNGSNIANYPNTSLSKQLKTVARMIVGGSKTKIFQVNIKGFDTHALQVESGAAHLGLHQTLISDVADSIKAFQEDIESLGIADKIITTTFSEFGRKVRENGNLGTDHGTLSPFFIIGKGLNAGVYGNHPIFTNATEFQYDQSQRRYDYRQIFGTLLQDWLGADNALIQNAELSEYTTEENKIPFIASSVNAYPNFLSSAASSSNTLVAVNVLEENGWTYYASEGSTDYVFAIEHLPTTGTGANTNAFTAEITITQNTADAPNNVYSETNAAAKEGTFVKGLFWNIEIKTGSLNGWVNMRWFNNSGLETALENTANAFSQTNSIQNTSNKIHFKTVGAYLILPNNITTNGHGLSQEFHPLLNPIQGLYNQKSYWQYNTVSDIGNSGGSILIKATETLANNLPKPEAGMIRFNSTTKKLEGYDGTNWVPFH